MLSVETAPRSNGKHVSFAMDGRGSSVENNVYTGVSNSFLKTSNFSVLKNHSVLSEIICCGTRYVQRQFQVSKPLKYVRYSRRYPKQFYESFNFMKDPIL
jgi:hypothetical protein